MMLTKYARIGLLACAALSLASCGASPNSAGSTPAPTTGTVVATVDTVVLTGQRALGVAELWYKTGAQLVDKQVLRGNIKGATATKVRAWNTEALKLLKTGKTTSDIAEKARAAARLLEIGDLFRSLL